MAFALVGFEAREVGIKSTSVKLGIQQVVLDITATAADVDLDISDAGGTFWTAAKSNTQYGALASSALADLQRIAAQAQSLLSVESEQLLPRAKVAGAPDDDEYSVSVNGHLPDIAFKAADGVDGSIKLVLTLELRSGISPVAASYGQLV